MWFFVCGRSGITLQFFGKANGWAAADRSRTWSIDHTICPDTEILYSFVENQDDSLLIREIAGGEDWDMRLVRWRAKRKTKDLNVKVFQALNDQFANAGWEIWECNRRVCSRRGKFYANLLFIASFCFSLYLSFLLMKKTNSCSGSAIDLISSLSVMK